MPLLDCRCLDGPDYEMTSNQTELGEKRTADIGTFRKGLPRYHRAVKYVAAYAVLGYILVMSLFLGAWCKPVNWYWKVPVPNCKYPRISPRSYAGESTSS